MDMSEDCWEHVGLLQEVSAEPPPPPPAPDFLIQQPESPNLLSREAEAVEPRAQQHSNRQHLRKKKHLDSRNDFSVCSSHKNVKFDKKDTKFTIYYAI
ncbi:hypothetical protein EAG_07989 [Camponotus floridanus]|uniref:Uncharacterized protein n=1 Tax=Camponotus floridanus TaxID=104421 RepID=E2AIB4_CAMFO|nr:hypothetical protein EAG_07989 [Camponotus floridanus]